MKSLTEERVCQLAMSPLYVLFLVASEHLAPERITERHIVRSMEYGLDWKTAFSEQIFELLRSNLHEFYATFPREYGPSFADDMRAELLVVKQELEQLSGPQEMIADFKLALKNLALFVAAGGAFRKQLEDAKMQAQAAWIADLLD